MGQGSESLIDREGEEEAREEAHLTCLYDAMADYEDAKAAPIGAEITCATCGNIFRKQNKQHAFCSNKGRHNCEDQYRKMTRT